MFKRFYEDELEYLREMGGEFASAYPDIAAELGIEGRDPDVERLLQGFAFLTGRIREAMEAEFPELLYPVMGQIWPHAVRPTPACCIVEFKPQAGMFKAPLTLERGARMEAQPIDGTVCQFRTCYDTEIRPVAINSVRLTSPKALQVHLWMRLVPLVGAAMQVQFERPYRIHLHGGVRQAYGLYHWLLRELRAVHVRVLGPKGAVLAERTLPPTILRAVGWDEDQSLLPYDKHSLTGFRHLHEYFLFRDKFLFLELTGLEWIGSVSESLAVDICFDLNPMDGDPISVSRENLRLHCVPAVNLFPFPARPIRLEMTRSEYLVQPESENPHHYEIFSLERVAGFDKKRKRRVDYLPFYSFQKPPPGKDDNTLIYQVHLRPAAVQRRTESGSAAAGDNQAGVDHYVSFVNPHRDAELPPTVVSIEMLATNHNLPRRLRPGDVCIPTSDIPTLVTFGNIGPFSTSTPALIGREGLWRYFAHQTLGWSFLRNRDALCGLLRLYDFPAAVDMRARRNFELLQNAIETVRSRPEQRVIGRPPSVVQGTHVELRVRESYFAHVGELYVFGCALSRFLASVRPINTFVKLTLVGLDQGIEYSWEPELGGQPLL